MVNFLKITSQWFSQSGLRALHCDITMYKQLKHHNLLQYILHVTEFSKLRCHATKAKKQLLWHWCCNIPVFQSHDPCPAYPQNFHNSDCIYIYDTVKQRLPMWDLFKLYFVHKQSIWQSFISLPQWLWIFQLPNFCTALKRIPTAFPMILEVSSLLQYIYIFYSFFTAMGEDSFASISFNEWNDILDQKICIVHEHSLIFSTRSTDKITSSLPWWPNR